MTEKRLYAIVLRLAAMRRGALPADHGDKARAALLSLIQQGDSPLAQQLHDDNNAKPYTISLVQGGKRGKDGAQHFGEGDSAEWRFSLLIEPAFEALLRKYLLNRALPHIRIGAVSFAILDAFTSGTSHADSGYITLTGLTERWSRPPEDLPRMIQLDFISPTAFNLGQDPDTKQYRIRFSPDARTLYSSLRKRWVKLGGVDASDGFDDWVADHVEQIPLTVQTQTILVKNRPINTFSGKVRYQLYGTDVRWLAYLHLLTELTFWTGVGYQTTFGMGQVRRSSQ
ncbi:MAG: CRISPR system precrRNA processing endoribonuclease RAMP protein Cas6 [Phototrophicaceae bacterium]|jgi:CRISPR-associated endoribonuclease Cas6